MRAINCNLNSNARIVGAIIHGVIAVPILYTIIKIVNDKKILGKKINGRISNVIGCITVAIMGSAVVIMFVAWGK
jgi:Mn2+/Fe2+ NRAMP family transporter